VKISKYYRSFLRRKLNKCNRKRLNQKEFTIISSNCVGGVITHELGRRFDSPTVNMYFEPSDYLKFIENLEYYIKECELTEDKGRSISRGYPVGRLNDLILYFVHYDDFESAKKKWNARCKRIHWENLYFVLTQRDGCTEEQVYEFLDFSAKNKVVFTTNDKLTDSQAYYIPGSVEGGEVIDLCLYKTKYTGRRWIDEFDYADFLNK